MAKGNILEKLNGEETLWNDLAISNPKQMQGKY